MTLNEFIDKYDREDSIVLLEGKRNVLESDRQKLVALGQLLASRTSKMIFRSGNALGSDKLFSEGVSAVNDRRLQVITPYTGHRDKTNQAYETISLDDLNIANEPEVIYGSKGNKKMGKLIDQLMAGNKNRNSVKAVYILRDTVKVIGTKTVQPCTFSIFYDDLKKPQEGGTGHTMNVCEENEVPFIDQRTWFDWLDK